MSIECEQFDPKNATSVAEWYRYVMVKRGYEVDFTLNAISLLDRYCEEVLWEMDQSTESFFKEDTAFIAYVGEVIVRNSRASWFGEFDLDSYAANYYTSFVGFEGGPNLTPGLLTYRVSNRSKDEFIEDGVRSAVKKLNEFESV